MSRKNSLAAKATRRQAKATIRQAAYRQWEARYAEDFIYKTFTCGNCEAVVQPIHVKIFDHWPSPRNSCTECNWSKHIELGQPCGELMKPEIQQDGYIKWDCLGCDFTMTGPFEKDIDRLAAGEVEQLRMTLPEGVFQKMKLNANATRIKW